MESHQEPEFEEISHSSPPEPDSEIPHSSPTEPDFKNPLRSSPPLPEIEISPKPGPSKILPKPRQSKIRHSSPPEPDFEVLPKSRQSKRHRGCQQGGRPPKRVKKSKIAKI